ncbi:alpha/beta hydrolase [Formosa algae]|uniref:Alpha/beta superfamily hydrolase n=1 Tax=Formosa algae TaxID=225843 RepID=A0A9X1CBS2_9FLAO|nr:alpha/beta hydrolase-fold protein [Formosa algae]MBP1840332.1 putative alpha/beta superfamily hydrolase [Formosa algae]MDQ0334196.1 putative alpha/beta superfamily hydrolase [Formosa algae]OEI79515.1 esterase [Formosa algae]PNW29532.1 esterase [Formosa algae]
MKRILYLFLLLFSCQLVSAQAIYETIQSEKLGSTRKLKIQLPRNYSENVDKKYPLVIVFDGDYMFEVVAGNVDYYSYWEDVPEVIVVGINQIEHRYNDTMFSEQNSLPIDSSAKFFEFIGMELLPFIQEKYRTEDFKLAIGHGATANFINYYLLKDKPLFQSYIVISPELAPNMTKYIPDRLGKMDRKTFYYLATTTDDIESVKKGTHLLNTAIKNKENDYLKYQYDEFEGLTHYSIVAQAVPKALENIFYVYQPITSREFEKDIMASDEPAIDYLKNKYESIKELYGVDKTILVNDFKAIAAAIEKKSEFKDFQELGKMARESYPETMLGQYYLARFYEETNQPKKAMKTYQSSYIFDEIAGLTKDDMIERANRLKADFGY